MALGKRSESSKVYLEAKYYCLWRGIKGNKKVEGCDEVEANNPATGTKVKKYGYIYENVSGHAVKLEKYDVPKEKYGKRYYGFRLHLVDGTETYVLDMPYSSQMLRRFLHVARNLDWALPIRISVFKGKKKDQKAGAEPTGIWFQQRGETVKPYYTKEQPHGMPEGVYDTHEEQWDFRAQHRWLIDRLQAETIPDIDAAAARVAPPIEADGAEPPEYTDDGPPPTDWDDLDEDSVPF